MCKSIYEAKDLKENRHISDNDISNAWWREDDDWNAREKRERYQQKQMYKYIIQRGKKTG